MRNPVVAPKQDGRARAGRNPAPLVVVLGGRVVQEQLAAVRFAPPLVQVHDRSHAAAVAVAPSPFVAMVVAVPHVTCTAPRVMRHLHL